METSELTARAVAVMTATVTGAAGAVGQGAGAAVADALRARLVSTERGRAALDTLNHAPEDPAAQDSARSVVQEEIEADPELRHQLQLRLTAPGTDATGSLLITGSQVSRSSIALGPLTINNTRGGRAVVVLGAALLLALVVLAVYGGMNLIVVDDSPESSQDDSARHAVRALNVSEVMRVVPDLTSMPSGWERSGSVRTGKNEDNGCSGAEARFKTAYGRTSEGTVVGALFTVWSCPRVALTAKGFEETRSGIANNNKATELPLPELGDQRAAITHYNADLDETTAHAVLRVGTVLVELEYDPVVPDDPEWSAEFEQLASMVAARAQQVQNA
ncbi:hypothetical protein OG342_01045 [Streptomyces bobili]|uniref:hypothetical protein n=1 Tax=Streptomyces bobili TaxID=67280 RepID=UPI0022596E2E|nr:hypothetical protein [Streptomyces bobili]MCX5521476.1 hypothetical protein [Streptomyces bobili]